MVFTALVILQIVLSSVHHQTATTIKVQTLRAIGLRQLILAGSSRTIPPGNESPSEVRDNIKHE